MSGRLSITYLAKFSFASDSSLSIPRVHKKNPIHDVPFYQITCHLQDALNLLLDLLDSSIMQRFVSSMNDHLQDALNLSLDLSDSSIMQRQTVITLHA